MDPDRFKQDNLLGGGGCNHFENLNIIPTVAHSAVAVAQKLHTKNPPFWYWDTDVLPLLKLATGNSATTSKNAIIPSSESRKRHIRKDKEFYDTLMKRRLKQCQSRGGPQSMQ